MALNTLGPNLWWDPLRSLILLLHQPLIHSCMSLVNINALIDLLYINHLEWNFIHVRIDINSQANEIPQRKVDVSPSSSLESRLVHRTDIHVINRTIGHAFFLLNGNAILLKPGSTRDIY